MKSSSMSVFQKSTAADVETIDCISLGTAVPACQVSDMNSAFLDKLLLAQKAYGKKFRINSAYRSLSWEKSKGRSGRSSHCKGIAVDIGVSNHQQRLYIVAALVIMGFRRIGIAKSFIHVDDDESKVPSMWLYDKDNLNVTF